MNVHPVDSHLASRSTVRIATCRTVGPQAEIPTIVDPAPELGSLRARQSVTYLVLLQLAPVAQPVDNLFRAREPRLAIMLRILLNQNLAALDHRSVAPMPASTATDIQRALID